MHSTTPLVAVPLVTARFVVLCLCGLAYFVAIGVPVTVLPMRLVDELGGSDLELGLTAGAFGVAAAVLRPFIGPLGDRRGRRALVVVGSTVAAGGLALSAMAGSIAVLIVARFVAGAGEAAVFTGLAAGIQDLAPPHRRAEAASYFSVVVYLGFVVGPALGEQLAERASTQSALWWAAGLCLLAVVFALRLPGPNPDVDYHRPSHLFHRAAVRPALVLGVGLLGYSGYLAFAAVHADDVGIDLVASVFAVYAIVVLTLRVVASRVPDRLGPRTTSTFALAMSMLALVILALWASPAGVYLGTAVLAVGQTFLFPALFALTVDTAPEAERSHAIGSFSLGFDLSVGVGGSLFGGLADVANRRLGFGVGAVLCAVGLLLARRLLPATGGPALPPRSVAS